MTKRRIELIGVPIEEGASTLGCSMGPKALRIAGIKTALEALGHDVTDHGDLSLDRALSFPVAPVGRANRWQEVANWVTVVSNEGYRLGQGGGVPVFLGGDHSFAAGSINAAARLAEEAGKPLCVIWLDAHSDFNTPASSESGNLHGMPVAALTGAPELSFLYTHCRQVKVPTAAFYQFGIRSVDGVERSLIRKQGIKVFDMRIVDEFGFSRLMREVLEGVGDAWVHVSLDVDFLDPEIAPAVGTRVVGGAGYREAHLLMELLYESGRVCSVDVAELNPFLDHGGKTATLAADLVASLFGKRIF